MADCEPTLEVRFAIARVIRQVRPDVVVTRRPDACAGTPSFGYINHPDHIAAGDATLAAIMPTANTLLAAPELLAEGSGAARRQPCLPVELAEGSVFIPLDERDMAARSPRCASTTASSPSGILEEGVREWAGRAAAAAREQGVECEFAEGFMRITLRQQERETKEAVETAGEAAATA